LYCTALKEHDYQSETSAQITALDFLPAIHAKGTKMRWKFRGFRVFRGPFTAHASLRM